MTSEAAASDRPGAGADASRGRPALPPAPPPPVAGPPPVPALDALLRDLDALRTTLQTDLSLAVGAVEAGAPDLAAHLLQADRDEVAAFRRRAAAHLDALHVADGAGGPACRRAADPAPPPARRRVRGGRRRSRLLPAAPLVAAAAALVTLLGTGPAPSGTTRSDAGLLASWEELVRLSSGEARAGEVRAAARSLHAEVASAVARADADPAAARQALALLRRAQQLLTADDDVAALQDVLQQSRELAAGLLAGLPAAPSEPRGTPTGPPAADPLSGRSEPGGAEGAPPAAGGPGPSPVLPSEAPSGTAPAAPPAAPASPPAAASTAGPSAGPSASVPPGPVTGAV